MKKERKQFSEQDYVSNEETPVETRDGRHVEKVISLMLGLHCVIYFQ